MTKNETDLLNSLHLEQDGVTLVTPCLQCTFYFRYAPYDGVRDFVAHSRSALGDALNYLSWGKRYVRVTEKSENKLQRILKEVDTAGSGYHCLHMRSHKQDKGCSAASLSFHLFPQQRTMTSPEQRELVRRRLTVLWGRQPMIGPLVSEVRVSFPLDHPLADPPAFKSWLFNLSCVREGTFIGGHAGFGLNTFHETSASSFEKAMDEKVDAVLLRHPGLDFSDSGAFGSNFLRYVPGDYDYTMQMKRVQWLNFLTDETLKLCRGREAVLTKLAQYPEVCAEPVGGGLCIEAGSAPALGDNATGDRLFVYRKVADVLSPARIQMRGEKAHFKYNVLITWLEELEREGQPITPEQLRSKND